MEELKSKCNFVKCYAGEGVAGNGCCFLGGKPQDPNCDKFKDEDEDEELREQGKRRAMSRWHR